jgi:hypothetical protein
LENTQEYYAGRGKHARAMALAAHDQTIAQIHQELAEHYEALAAQSRQARRADKD